MSIEEMSDICMKSDASINIIVGKNAIGKTTLLRNIYNKYKENHINTIFMSEIYNNITIPKHDYDIINEYFKQMFDIDDLIYNEYEIKFKVGDEYLSVESLGYCATKLLNIVDNIIKSKDGILFIDNFDFPIHHTSIKVMWNLFKDFCNKYNVKIYIIAHSLELIKGCVIVNKYDNDVKLFRLQKNNNKIEIIGYESDELAFAFDLNWEIR